MSTPAEDLANQLPRPVPTRTRHFDTSAMAMERTRLKLTMAQVCANIGISVSIYHHIESGKQDPKLSQAFLISRFYSVPVDTLWKPLPNPPNDSVS